MKSIPLRELIPISGSRTHLQDGELEVSGFGYVQTPEAYQVPLQIEVTAKTDSTNLRLHFGKGQIILNWEENPDCLVIHEPVMGHDWKVQQEGRIPANEWVTITWQIDTTAMKVLVNGEERFSFCPADGLVTLGSGMPWLHADYTRLTSPFAIGPAWGSTVTVRSVCIREVPK